MWRLLRVAKADSEEAPVAEEAVAVPAEAIEETPISEEEVAAPSPEVEAPPVAEEPLSEPVPEKPVAMPKELSPAEVEAVKDEIAQEFIDKALASAEDLSAPKVVTAPYDPRFPSTNQSRHCFVRYNEYYKCIFERGTDNERCNFYKRAYESLCPADWVEEWQTLREEGKWFGKY